MSIKVLGSYKYCRRIITVVEFGGLRIPFYRSTGSNGIKSVWFPFAGIHTDGNTDIVRAGDIFDDPSVGWIVKMGLVFYTNTKTARAFHVGGEDHRSHTERCACESLEAPNFYGMSVWLGRNPPPEPQVEINEEGVNTFLRETLRTGDIL